MQHNYKILMIALSIGISTNLKAQLVGGSNTIDLSFIEYKKDVVSNRYNDIKGLPYLLNDWAIGSIKSINNVEKKGLMLNFDEVRNEILIKDNNGKIMSVSTPVIEFTILDKDTNRNFKLGFAKTKLTDLTTFFEVLEDGKVKFLKRNNKGISENKEYSGNIAKSITDDIRFFLVKANNEPIQIKLDQKSIFALLADKETELTAYVKDNNLNLKKEYDVIKLINFYNKI